MASKNNKRKYAAIALGIVGIAGLSLASAAQLNVTDSSPLVGVSVNGECQPAAEVVNVAYDTSFTNGAFNITNIKLTGINAACNGKPVTVYMLNQAGAQVGATFSGTAAAAGVTIPVPTTPTPVNAASVYSAAVSIN
jgi:hypothetical protein